MCGGLCDRGVVKRRRGAVPNQAVPVKIPLWDGHFPPCAFAEHTLEQWPLLRELVWALLVPCVGLRGERCFSEHAASWPTRAARLPVVGIFMPARSGARTAQSWRRRCTSSYEITPTSRFSPRRPECQLRAALAGACSLHVFQFVLFSVVRGSLGLLF